MKEFTLKDIPEKDVEKVKGDFSSNGCVNVRAEKQDNGLWSITASCPE